MSSEAGFKAICEESANPVVFATLGSARCPGNEEIFRSHTDPSIRSNEGRAFVIE
jgi:hypothetical protein